MNLASLVRGNARCSNHPAVQGSEGLLTYGELDALADRAASALRELGVKRGDRVGIWAEKSPHVVAMMQGALRIGAAYVPVDPQAPAGRAQHILRDCDVRCLFSSTERANAIAKAIPDVAVIATEAVADRLETTAGKMGWADLERLPAIPPPSPPGGDALAYILYTSGSTGTPKGVCISHANALAFVEEMVRRLDITGEDRLSNHAPFHFDLSVFDLYAAFHAGASVTLIPETAAYAPRQLVDLLHRRAITIWYSVPSALMLMMDHAALCEDAPPDSLRVVLFAGEVFPIPYVARLRRAWPKVRFLNLYGPTGSYACTIHEAGVIDESAGPLPIGHACCGDRVWAETAPGVEAAEGELGELMVEGPTVMLGYWGKPAQDRVYATGDLVRRRADGAFLYHGRRDGMVKVRGHRVELGEIEAALATHPEIREVAVTTEGAGVDARLVAFVVPVGKPPSLLSAKQHCAERLPRYMVVHRVCIVDSLPRTSTGKIDRQRLASASGASTQEKP